MFYGYYAWLSKTLRLEYYYIDYISNHGESLVVFTPDPSSPKPKKLLDQLRDATCLKHYPPIFATPDQSIKKALSSPGERF
jgi:hypothetical protein